MGFCTREGAAAPAGGAASTSAPPLAALSFQLPRVVRFGRAPFASLSVSGPRVEAHTSVSFPSECCTFTTKDCPNLVGVG